MPRPGIGRFPQGAALPLLEVWDGPALGMAGAVGIVRRGNLSGNSIRPGSFLASAVGAGHVPSWVAGEWIRTSVNGAGSSSVAGDYSFPLTTQRGGYPAALLGLIRPGLRFIWEYVAFASGAPDATVAHGPRSATQHLAAFGTTLGYELRGNGGANWELARRLVNAGAITVPLANAGSATTRARFRWELDSSDAPALRLYRDGVLLYTASGVAEMVTAAALTSVPRPAVYSGAVAITISSTAHYLRVENLD